MRVLIIDYGMGNLASVKRAVEECGSEALVSDDSKDVKLASHIILPGVGAFGQSMDTLQKRGWVNVIKEEVLQLGVPFLGVCLGMQLLAEKGYEGGEFAGLGLLSGEVIEFKPNSPEIRVHHVGWNEVYKTQNNCLFDNIADGTDFYFVHSYHFVTEDTTNIIAKTPYCGEFVSAVAKENVFGVQFHPEKSQRPGFQLLKNFLKI